MRSLRTLRRTLRNDAPVPYTGKRGTTGFSGGGTGGMSTAQQLKAMQTNGTLYAIVDATTTAVASTEWGLYRTAKNAEPGTDDARERVNVHAAWALWNNPNPWYTRHELVESVQQHIELTGLGYLIVVKRGTLPVELWPVRPDRMTAVPSTTDYLKGWIYTTPDGDKIPFPADEVIPLRKPNPLDPFAGSSPVGAIGDDLDAASYAAAYNRAFFENSAEPGGILSVDGQLNDDEFDQLTARWAEQHRGVARAHRVAVVEHGMKYTPRQVTQRDMQFAELRQTSRDVIMEPYRISKTTLGISDDVNLANAKAAEYQFARNLTVPRLSRWREALNHRLLPMFGATGTGVEFDFDSPVREDEDAANAERQSRATAAATLLDADCDRPAVLAWAGLPPELAGEASDPKVDLLTKLVIGAPSLAPTILPMLGFDLPAPAPAPAPQPPAPAPATALAARAGDHPHEHVRAEGAPDVDLAPVQRDFETVRDKLLDRWADVRAAWRADLRRQIVRAIDDGTSLAHLEVDSDAGAARIREAVADMWSRATATVRKEAAAQGVDLTATAPTRVTAAARKKKTPESFDDIAADIAALVAQGLALAAGQEATRVKTPDKTGAQVAGEVDAALAAQTDARTEATLSGVLTGAQNAARVEAMAEGPTGSIYADETLDGATCAPCRTIDGRFVCRTDDLAPYDRLYTALGGYVDCLGRERCRGTVTGVWRPATTTSNPEDV